MDVICEIIEESKAALIKIPNRLDASNSMPFKDKMTELVDKGYYLLLIDLSQTNFIDSSGLGALVGKISTCRKNGGDVRLIAPTQRVVEILQITNLDKVLKIYKSKNDALK
ncbi:MAG: STAS domain-containing protein [Calditerrivibrio sp.]|nr:STAS domain-containing protein [Calditerrivibrio sp.]